MTILWTQWRVSRGENDFHFEINREVILSESRWGMNIEITSLSLLSLSSSPLFASTSRSIKQSKISNIQCHSLIIEHSPTVCFKTCCLLFSSMFFCQQRGLLRFPNLIEFNYTDFLLEGRAIALILIEGWGAEALDFRITCHLNNTFWIWLHNMLNFIKCI